MPEQSKKLIEGIKEIYSERTREFSYCKPKPCPGISLIITPSAVRTAKK